MSEQRPLSGFLFALTAAMMWGGLPIGVKLVLSGMNEQTLVWFRFFVAAVGLLSILFWRKDLPDLRVLVPRERWLLLLGILGLSANFYLFNVSLRYIPATTSQVLSPLSSFVMLFVGIFLFKEKFGIHQKIGFVALLCGLALFFNNRWQDFAHLGQYARGVLIALCATTVWINYAIAQKLLLRKLRSPQILLMVYIGCSLVFTPMADLSQVRSLNAVQIGALIFCCLNTLIAYGSYAEALNRWDVSKVSAVMTQISVFTMIFSALLNRLAPQYFPDQQLNLISYIGAFLVVSGALLSAIGHKIFSRKGS